jgi:hypothetical protein
MPALTRSEIPLSIEGDGVEFRMQTWGDMALAWVRLPKGTDLRPLLRGLPEDRCQCPHWGVVLGGKLAMHTENGVDTYSAGDAFYWPPGHAPEALEDCEYVDVSPALELTAVLAHVRKRAAATA